MADFARKAEMAADNAWVKLAARISLPVLAFLGMQAWADLRDQGRSINQVLLNQAVTDAKLEDALRRINRLEETQTRKAALGFDPRIIHPRIISPGAVDPRVADPRIADLGGLIIGDATLGDRTVLSTAERMKR
jgi:hypothetical protein